MKILYGILVILLIGSASADWTYSGSGEQKVYSLSLTMTGSNVSFTTPTIQGTVIRTEIILPSATTDSVLNISDDRPLLFINNITNVRNPIILGNGYNNINILPNHEGNVTGWSSYMGGSTGTFAVSRGGLKLTQGSSSVGIRAWYPVYLYKAFRYRMSDVAVLSSASTSVSYYFSYLTTSYDANFQANALGSLGFYSSNVGLPASSIAPILGSTTHYYVIYNEAAINAWMVNQPVLQPVTPLERDHMMNSPLYITVRGKTGSTFSMKMTVVE